MSKEVSVKVSEETKDEGQFNLEGILSELGSFGKYQLVLLFLLAFRDSFLAMCNFNYVFTAAEVGYRCYVPECEGAGGAYNESWSYFTQSNGTDKCYRMSPVNDTFFDPPPLNHSFFTSPDKCSQDYFSRNSTRPCEKIIYDDYNSIVAEFDLGCSPWKSTMVGTVHNLGLVFSFVLSGFISDKYGRKVVIVATPLVVAVAGLIKSFSVNYWMLLVLEFLETALGYGNASMVLSLEMVSHERRVVFSCLADMLANAGSAAFGLIAWRVPYWRHTMRAIYAPLLIVVFYIFLMDEGVRWLLAHNRRDEAVRVLRKVARTNRITLSSAATDMLDRISEQRKSQEAGQSQNEKVAILSVLRSRAIMFRVSVIAACFVCCTFVYNGTIINSGSIPGNKYVTFSLLLLLAVPTRVVTALTLTRFGRRAPICIAYTLCGVFFIASGFVPKSAGWASMLLYLAGKMCSSYGLFSMHVVAMEVFPTTSRNSLVNLANTFGRLGSVLASQAPVLKQYMVGLPSIVFGVVALGPAVLALLLPDTSRATLPDDVAAAEQLDQPTPDPAAPQLGVSTSIKE